MASTPFSTSSRSSATFLAPGQRYTEAGTAAWRVDKQWTVVHVGQFDGAARVIYRCPNGTQLTMPAEQFEAAVVSGQVIPVVAFGLMARC